MARYKDYSYLQTKMVAKSYDRQIITGHLNIHIPQSSTAAVSVDYYEMQNGTVSELKTVTVNFINMEDGNGGYKLVANTVNNPFTTANTVTLSQIKITGAGVDYTCETSNTIVQGQKLYYLRIVYPYIIIIL